MGSSEIPGGAAALSLLRLKRQGSRWPSQLKCTLRKKTVESNECVAFNSVVENDEMKKIIDARWGGCGLPVLCHPCANGKWKTASSNAAKVLDTPAGQAVLRTLEAFQARDDGEDAVDSKGQWHAGVALNKTCKLEPHEGETASAALTLAGDCSSDRARVDAVCRRYIFVSSRYGPKQRQQRTQIRLAQSPMTAQESIKQFLDRLVTGKFILPFYYHMLLQLQLHDNCDAEFEKCMTHCLTTGWGGSPLTPSLEKAGFVSKSSAGFLD
jgi:hypothetical protein